MWKKVHENASFSVYLYLKSIWWGFFHVSWGRNIFSFIFEPLKFQNEQLILNEISSYFHLDYGQVILLGVRSGLNSKSFSVHWWRGVSCENYSSTREWHDSAGFSALHLLGVCSSISDISALYFVVCLYLASNFQLYNASFLLREGTCYWVF